MARLLFAFLAWALVHEIIVPGEIYAQETPKFDLVLRNGKIVDGTSNPWFRGDVAIQGDRIALLGTVPAKTGKREIDVKGHVIAPGFIDMHSHSDYTLLEDGNLESKIRQGVTTEVLGESGSAAPNLGLLTPPAHSARGKQVRFETMGQYFDTVSKLGVSTNVVSYVGLGNLWRCVMGNSHARPTANQFEQIKSHLENAMKDGAAGMSCMLAAPPDSLPTTDELVELCKIVAKYKGIFVTHIRHEGTGVFDAIREVIEIARRSGVTLEILHIKIADQQYWGRMNEVIKLVADARNEGISIGANIYPYTRGNNNLASIIPPWAHEGGAAKMLSRLKEPVQRAKMKKDIHEGITGWYNHYTAIGGDWKRMLISAKNQYQGLTMDRVLELRKKQKGEADPLDMLFDLLIDEGGSVSTIYDHHTEKDMQLALQQPWVSIGSDGFALAVDGPLRRGHPHPRSFGTFPRVLGRYVRELKLLTLEDAVRKMTSLGASKLGLHERGLLRPGMFADITVFDPDRILDHSTYTEPFQYSEGIEVVIVNGQVVLDQGKHTGTHSGRVLRHNAAGRMP